MEAILLIGVLLLAYWNGANDVSRSIATLVGSGVATDRQAAAWGALWTTAGALLAGTVAIGLLQLFTDGLIRAAGPPQPAFPLAVLCGAAGWIVFATRAGLPVSTTHAITGAIAGMAVAAFGIQGVHWSALSTRVLLPLLISPAAAMLLTAALYPLFIRTAGRWTGVCLCLLPVRPLWVAVDQRGRTRAYAGEDGLQAVLAPSEACGVKAPAIQITPDTLHWLTGGLTALARGMNDAPKIVAVVAILHAVDQSAASLPASWALYAAALAMGIGSYRGGYRVIETMARRIVPMDPLQGFSANLTTALLVGLASPLGLPVSTTHVSSGALFGIGLARNGAGVQWKIVREIALAWMVTLPAAGLLAAGGYWLLGE
jgi:PiT family inorganic phosphate transporter